MANEEHLAILKKGVGPWNEWRRTNPEVKPDLGGAGLADVILDAADLRHANLEGANLRGAKLSGAKLFHADMSQANLYQASLARAHLGGANLSRAMLLRATLPGVDLADATLVDAGLREAGLVEGNLTAADLRGADLTGADLRRAVMEGANLGAAKVREANLMQADLSGATCRHADLGSVGLEGAILNGVDFYGADLSRARLRDTNFAGSLMERTLVTDVDLSLAKGLEAVLHVGPSTIGIDTIYRSKGRIPDAFLRGAGVPEAFIVQMRALIGAMEPIEFYSCFISYSSKDEEFTKRLHRDLQGEHVRCWFAPEDMKIGEKFRQRIDEAIRVHDKLLLVLTENSVKSAWVEKEVETAFEKERRQGRTVLFPIRLDDAVMGAEEAWAADIRRTRHIGDFCGWKEHDKYGVAFKRLMRDLRAADHPRTD